MSDLGTKQTSHHAQSMSANWGKADIMPTIAVTNHRNGIMDHKITPNGRSKVFEAALTATPLD
jgi:hypothetical protein